MACLISDEEKDRLMRDALAMGQAALTNGEIPVGCVIVEQRGDVYTVIASGSNQTNESRNGTRHAEIVAVESLYSVESSFKPHDDRANKGILSNCDLYVTCEPCIMCAAALSKLGIRKVFFGCHNDRFGGNGSILSVHMDAYSNGMNSSSGSSSSSVLSSSADCIAETSIDNNCSSSSSSSGGLINTHSSSSICESMDNCSPPVTNSNRTYDSSYHKYEVQAGLLKDEAIGMFQDFYTSENRRAPEAKRKRKIEKTFNSGAINAFAS